MEANHIPLIMQRLAQIVTENRIRKYSTALIVKIIVILKIYGVSYRPSKYFFNNHKEFMELLKIQDITKLQDIILQIIKNRLAFYKFINNRYNNPYNDSAAVASSVVKTCRDTTAQRRRKNGKYKDPSSSWGYGTMGYEYGRKVHASIDANSLSVMECKINTASVYDKNMAFEMIDSVRNYNYILMDPAYDSSNIYDYIFENTHAIPVIDTNRRRGIVEIN